MAQVTYVVQEGRAVKYGGPCVKCKGHVDPKRSWEAVLLKKAQNSSPGRPNVVAHAKCIGGKYGGVQGKWRGPDRVKVSV